MASYPILADSPGGITSALAQRHQIGQQDLARALSLMLGRQRETQRQRELQDSIMRRMQELESEDKYRQQLFKENARQFDATMDWRNAPKPVSMLDLNRVIDAASNLPSDQRPAFYKNQGLTDEQAMVAESQVVPYQRQLESQFGNESAAARTLNVDPRRRALLVEQEALAKEYPSRRGSILTELAGRLFGYGGGLGRAMPSPRSDIEAGVGRQRQAMDERLRRAQMFQESLIQDPRTGAYSAEPLPWMAGTNAPRMGRELPSQLLTDGAMYPPNATNVMPRQLTIDLPPSDVQVTPPRTPNINDMVRVLAPDGTVGVVPRVMLNQALRAGGRVLP